MQSQKFRNVFIILFALYSNKKFDCVLKLLSNALFKIKNTIQTVRILLSNFKSLLMFEKSHFMQICRESRELYRKISTFLWMGDTADYSHINHLGNILFLEELVC
jgi:hypothetical protein